MWKKLFGKKAKVELQEDACVVDKNTPKEILYQKLGMTQEDIEIAKLVEDLKDKGKIRLLRKKGGSLYSKTKRDYACFGYKDFMSYYIIINRSVFTFYKIRHLYGDRISYRLKNEVFSSEEVSKHFMCEWGKDLESIITYEERRQIRLKQQGCIEKLWEEYEQN